MPDAPAPSLSAAALTHALNWRYATKAFDKSRRISHTDWAALEASVHLAPSSFGLQPWKFLVIDSPQLRQQLLPLTWNQSQVVDASHLVVFARRATLTHADADRLIAATTAARGTPAAALAGYRGMITGTIDKFADPAHLSAWNARQIYIALGFFMAAAATMGIDTCPIEGFEPAKYDEVLGLPAQGFNATVVCAAGYRAATDKYASAPKVRFPASEVIEHR
jgi:nitroreductase